MKGHCCLVLGRLLVIVVVLLSAVIVSFQPQGALGMRDSIGAAASKATFNRRALKPDLNYGTAKRRVPNGSDPIHNRRAGKSGDPPAV